jgi:hypothetical protein
MKELARQVRCRRVKAKLRRIWNDSHLSQVVLRCSVAAFGMKSTYHSSASDTALRTRILRARTLLRDVCCTVSSILTLSLGLHPEMRAAPVRPVPSIQQADHASQAAERSGLIVIGFMGGRIKGDNFVHMEARMAKEMQQRYPRKVHTVVFANHDGHLALRTVLQLLDKNKDGRLSAEEKAAARIVIFGHSWGASETVALAGRLNKLNIPVLLTVQVDSVQKSHQDDGSIPPNVREAVNFYQSEGMLHGRSLIQAMDPEKTTILGNYESTYRNNPVSCAGYPWFARAFMKSHIEIENDPSVWSKIEALIQAKVLEGEPPAETTRFQPG